MSEAHTMIENALKKFTELLDLFKNKKNEMNNFAHSYMQKIIEAMVRQDELFADLKLVRGVGNTYKACLAEVVRRKTSMKLYMGIAGQLAEMLAMKRETEGRRCEDVHKTHGPFVSRDVLASMGLYDTPTQSDVNVAPYDTSLINIEIADVDRYALEYLVGLLPKVAFSRSSLGMSSGSSLSDEAEEKGLDNLDKDSFEDILEVSDLVEIAGTSKMEVENAKLKTEVASAVSRTCSLGPQVEYEKLDESGVENLLKNAAEKTAEALQAKNEYGKHLLSMFKEKQRHCDSYEKRVRELESQQNNEKGGKDNVEGEMSVYLSNSSTAESPPKPFGNNVSTGICINIKHSDDIVFGW